jgi:hypothetical protein
MLNAVIDNLPPPEEPGVEFGRDPDPLLAALYEMGLPLPPEPSGTGQQTVRIETSFCCYCSAKIPEADKISGAARMVNQKWACKECLSKPEKSPRSGSGEPKVDALLSGLDQEPLVVDTSKRPRMTVVEHDAEAERKQRQAPPPAAPPAKPDAGKEKKKLFGEDFEEIG